MSRKKVGHNVGNSSCVFVISLARRFYRRIENRKRKNHEEIVKGLISLGDGIQQKGERVKAKEDIDIEEDLSNLQEIVIYELPKPLLPDKNDSRTEQGGASSNNFNALEIDPETGRPILEKKEE